MYNTKIVCTYNTPEVFLPTDIITDQEKEFIRDVIYRQEILDIFEITEFNEVNMRTSIEELYERLKDNVDMTFCMRKLSERFMKNDELVGLKILCSFDYLYLTHICICEYIETGVISEINMNNLKSSIS